MFSKFVHLHAHSEYSLDTGFFSINDYVRYCYEQNVYAAVITEKFNLFSAIKFYKECFNFGIKPIIGCEFFLDYNDNYVKLLLLSKNYNGYKNLIKLVSQSYFNLKNGIPLLKKEWLPFVAKDLIAIGLSFESDIGNCLIYEKYEEANKLLKFWKNSFINNYYLSVTNYDLPIENIYIQNLSYFLKNCNIHLVFTNEICFLKKTDFLAYKSKLNTFDIKKNIKSEYYDNYFKNKYFKPINEIYNTLDINKNLFYNSFEIAKKCNLFLDFKKDFSPKYLKKSINLTTNFLSKISIEYLLTKLNNIEKNYWSIYIDRLKKELYVIKFTGFADYFLITYDFTDWSRQNNIFFGPGRGSGSSSLIAHLLSITNIDPIKYNLLFERFLNIYRISKPDFDIDFCIEGRDLIVDYIFDRYGSKYVAQIITFGIMAAKAAIRDIGRVLGYSYFFINKLIKLISNNFGISLKSELIENNILKTEYDSSIDVQIIVNLALKLESMVKNISKHAGGLVISNSSFDELLPFFLDCEEYKFITNFDKNDSESIGFSKFDFLGLKTLSILNSIYEHILSYYNIYVHKNLDFEKIISLTDYKTFILLQRADTLGIFQLDSFGLKSVIQNMRPEKFLDIVALIALYRPGPLQSGMLLSFIKRKIGTEKIIYIHNILKLVLSETYGMLVYQEQVMLLAQLFAGYNIGFADLLRIAMTKKNKSDIESHLENFKKGAALNNIDMFTAINVFNLIEKFAGYGFNKAHSVGYGLLTYNSAWLKAHYNIFFFTSLLSSDMENYENINRYIKEVEYFSIKIFMPDINRSFYPFTMATKYFIRYGLGVIKGLGKNVIAEIINNRAVLGSFHSFFDFLYRINVDILSKRVLESLVYSGCFNKINSLKFKLVLITTKIFDLYSKLLNVIMFNDTFLEKYFNYYLNNFNYAINYRQLEVKESYNLLNFFILKNLLDFYKYEIFLISNLSFCTGNYFNKIIAGIIKNIYIKKSNVTIFIDNFYESKEVIFSYNRYKFYEKILKKYNFVVMGIYKYNNIFLELFVENFYLFRFKFLKYLDIIFFDSFVSDVFLKYFFLKFNLLVKGCTKIRFKYSFKGKLKIVYLKNNINIYLHDNTINNFLLFKEIKCIKFVYFF